MSQKAGVGHAQEDETITRRKCELRDLVRACRANVAAARQDHVAAGQGHIAGAGQDRTQSEPWDIARTNDQDHIATAISSGRDHVVLEQDHTALSQGYAVTAQDHVVVVDQDRVIEHVLRLAEGMRCVAAYAAVNPEPPTLEIIEALHQQGVRVLLPYLTTTPDWIWYSPDTMRPSWREIPVPEGTPLGAAALAQAELILLPGLAGSLDGRRLGTGGGWYDRALRWAQPAAKRVLLLHDGEIFDDIPTSEWDELVDMILTPTQAIDCPPRNPAT